MDVEALIEQGIAELGLNPPYDCAERLARFVALLGKWNRGQKLTAITEPRAVVARHILDSLAGSPWVLGTRVLDVGSGAGLPGIPLAIADASRQLLLLDSRGKRVQFLIYVKQALKLDNVSVVQVRFEKYRPETGFDTLVTRAFAALPALAAGAMPFITAGARLVSWQRADPAPELERIAHARGLDYRVHEVRVPGIQAARHIAVIQRGPRESGASE